MYIKQLVWSIETTSIQIRQSKIQKVYNTSTNYGWLKWQLFEGKRNEKVRYVPFFSYICTINQCHIWYLDASKLSMMMSEKKRAWQPTLSITHALLEHKRQWKAMSIWKPYMYHTTYSLAWNENKVGDTKYSSFSLVKIFRVQ